MRRPGRVRNYSGLHGYVTAPALAWSGWRLRIPGGPQGGQYHGYSGDDYDPRFHVDPLTLSGPEHTWNPVWGGTALLEGDTLSDHVYRSPGEVRPRPNASGGANVLLEFQTKRSPGYSVAPGNYQSLGYDDPIVAAQWEAAQIAPQWKAAQATYPLLAPPPIASPSLAPSPSRGWPSGATEPIFDFGGGSICPQFRIACPPGATAVYDTGPCHSQIGCNAVPQPSPSAPGPVNMVQVASVPPVSPAPAPTVAATAADFLPAHGQPLPDRAQTPGIDIGAWLTSSTIWSAVPNWVLVAGGALFLFRSNGGGRRH